MKKLYILLLLLSTSCSEGYIEKDGKVYFEWFHGGNLERRESLVPADLETFEILPGRRGYFGKDKNYVFYKWTIIKGADPETYRVINEKGMRDYYAMDKNRIYYFERVISGSTSEGFQLIHEKGPYFRDKNQIYFKTEPLEDICSLDNFKVLEHVWSTDGCCYYWGVEKMPSNPNDYNHIKLFNGGVWKDTKQVYFRKITLPQQLLRNDNSIDTIDIASFREIKPFNGRFFEDKFGCIDIVDGRIDCIE